MGGNHNFKALKHTAGKHANVPNGDEIGIVRPLKHSQRGPARVHPAFGAGNFFLAFLLAKNDQLLEPRHSHQPLAAF